MKLTVINKESNRFGITFPDKKKLSARDVLRIQSQLISGFITGRIESQDAKSLSFLCSSYIQILQSVQTEQRLKNLEDKLK